MLTAAENAEFVLIQHFDPGTPSEFCVLVFAKISCGDLP